MARYIILTESLFTERDWRRFGCAELQSKGYEVIPLQIGLALGNKARPRPAGAFRSVAGAAELESLAALDRLLMAGDTGDIILVESRLSTTTRPLFRLLRTRQIRYVVVDLGTLPAYWLRSRRSTLSFAEYLEFRIGEVRAWLSRVKRLLIDMVADRFDYFRLQRPWLWLTAGTELPMISSGLPQFWRVRRMSVPSFDYLAAQGVLGHSKSTAPIAVFLDEAFVDHADFHILGTNSPVSNQYWLQLEKLFVAIEAHCGLKVVIAPHPKNAGAVPDKIGVRMGAIGRTMELVHDCTLVLCHASTSVSYAVLFRKPLMFITTDEIERSSYRMGIVRMSSRFAARRVNADRFAPAELVVPVVDESRYQAYEHAHLRAPDAIDESPWLVLHTLNAQHQSS
jgi:hypothetical protein